ncbi:MAG: transposase [Ktedonobacteraceae bacterium]|nr:transposase [Ktedonobacteraceae bacterium]
MLTRQQLQEMYDSGPAVMLHYVECLLSHLADVERIIGHQQQYRIDSLAAELARLRKQLERVKHRLARKECEVYALQRRIGELQAEVERAQQVQNELGSMAAVARDSHNSGLPPSSDPPRAKAANAVRRTRSLRGKSDKKVGGQAGHRGATLHQVEFPDRLKVHAPPRCRGCWASLAQCEVVAHHRRQVFDLPMVAMEVTEHWAQTMRCERCGRRTKARFPAGVNAPVQYGERVRSVATYLHKYQLLPFARTSEAMRDLFGCRISPGTIETTRHRASARLVGVEEQIKQGIKTSEVIGADETGLRVAGKSAWVHVARTDLADALRL